MYPLTIVTDASVSEYSFWLRYDVEDGSSYASYKFTVEVCGDEVLTCTSTTILIVQELNPTTPLTLSASDFDSQFDFTNA